MSFAAFFPGLHQPSDAWRFERVCISIRRLWRRLKPLGCPQVMVDSGAFRELELHGEYQHSEEVYATELHRLHTAGVVNIAVAVAQDFMCEDFMLARTKATDTALSSLHHHGPASRADLIAIHQAWTIERYDALVAALERLFGGAAPFPVLPVLQGYSPADYVRHVVAYGDRLKPAMWVGVGSVCKRNGDPEAIAAVLKAIYSIRPDLLLHGFGVKVTSLMHEIVRRLLSTADSMAWSYAARKQGRNGNSWLEAKAFASTIQSIVSRPLQPVQIDLIEWLQAAA